MRWFGCWRRDSGYSSGRKDDNMELKGRRKRGRLQGRLMDVNEDIQRVVVTEEDPRDS